ncbi:efflux RND transporter periplasmic adaptor subunit [Burkholderiaceae bacterium UC74_6]
MLKELRIEGAHREDHEGGGPPRWVWGVIAAIVVLALIAGAAWWFLAGNKPTTVQTTTAKANNGDASTSAVLQATGYVTAQRQATVSALVTGTLAQLLIEEGLHVKKGQVLARLDNHNQVAALAASSANLRSGEANKKQVAAQLAQARTDLRRQEELFASGMTTQSALDNARLAVASQAASLEARDRDIDAMRAQMAQAQLQLDYTIVRAPFDGVITAKAAQVGEIVSPLSAGGGFTRTGVGTIVDMTSLEVQVDVNEAYIAQVKAGMRCEAVLDAYPDWKIPAHVLAVIPTADRGKATVKVRVAMDERDERVVPDMGVRVSFLAETAKVESKPVPGVLVSPDTIQQRDGAKVVFVMEDGRARQRAVKLGADVGKFKLVTEGVKSGETVIVSPPAELKDGAAVMLKEENK